ERELGDRRVEHALRAVFLVEARRRREYAPGHRDVFAEEDDALVRRELLVERVADRGAEHDVCHHAIRASGRCSSSRSRERKRALSAPYTTRWSQLRVTVMTSPRVPPTARIATCGGSMI